MFDMFLDNILKMATFDFSRRGHTFRIGRAGSGGVPGCVSYFPFLHTLLQMYFIVQRKE